MLARLCEGYIGALHATDADVGHPSTGCTLDLGGTYLFAPNQFQRVFCFHTAKVATPVSLELQGLRKQEDEDCLTQCIWIAVDIWRLCRHCIWIFVCVGLICIDFDWWILIYHRLSILFRLATKPGSWEIGFQHMSLKIIHQYVIPWMKPVGNLVCEIQ